ncbi:hypothetical protein ACFVZM_06750 [Streptomyces sioyaensis]|uniref:hypothetical protein n=1 Tax=Streptomyces sioyaensis TaxID=67364 RepID=UPI0036C1E44A
MPSFDGYSQKVPYPNLTDAADIETAMQSLVNGVVPQTVMRFASASARAAALVNGFVPKPGMITYLIAEDRYDGRMADGSWQPLSPSGWKPLTPASGMVTQSGSPGYQVVNGSVQLRGRFARASGGQYTTGTDWLLTTIPSAYRPPTYQYWVTPVEMGAGIYYARTELAYDTGQIIVQVPPGSTSTTNGLHWAGIDGLTYSL